MKHNSRRKTKRQRDNRENISVYTDGSLTFNRGGWGAVIFRSGNWMRMYGGEKTNCINRMEITAAFMALNNIKEPAKINIYTDSELLRNLIHYRNCREIQTLKNIDIIESLYLLCDYHSVRCFHVRAHSGNRGNEIADKLAKRGKLNAI
jgi:ribonuclease HI